MSANIADRVVARKTMQFCEKPLVFCCKDTNSVKDIYEMALLLCGGKDRFEQAPCVVHYSEPISPLVYYDPAVDKIMFCAERNIPLINFRKMKYSDLFERMGYDKWKRDATYQ
jgi:trimethylamine--corrinoid protein Co-methyltransferase